MPKALLIFLLFVAVQGIVACGDKEDSTGGLAEGGPRDFSELIIPPGQLRDANLVASPIQRQAIADGVLTFAEYESGVLAAVACMADHGVGVQSMTSRTHPTPKTEPELNDRGWYVYLVRFSDDRDDAEVERIYKQCRASSSDVLEELWFPHTLPTLAELQQAREAMGSCLRTAGVQVSQHPAKEELWRIAFPPDGVPTADKTLSPSVLSCSAAVSQEFRLFEFIG